MMKKFIVPIILLILCNACHDKNNKQNNTQKGTLLSTVYKIANGYDAEISYNNFTGEISVLVNDKKCTNHFNLPTKDIATNNEVIINIDDYNFDGYKDFAIVGGYYGDLQHYVNLFNPETQEYTAFSSFHNVTVDHNHKKLINYVELSGNQNITEYYKVNGFDNLVFEKQIHRTAYNTDYENYNGDIGSLAYLEETTVFLEFNDKSMKETRFIDTNGITATYVIQGKRAYLYNKPAANGKTSMYLVNGDNVEIMDIAKGYFKVRFKNPKFGDIVKWIKYSGGKEA